ncbi:hypothetical protein ABIA39_002345 [Nocardia sp. GAS34]
MQVCPHTLVCGHACFIDRLTGRVISCPCVFVETVSEE